MCGGVATVEYEPFAVYGEGHVAGPIVAATVVPECEEADVNAASVEAVPGAAAEGAVALIVAAPACVVRMPAAMNTPLMAPNVRRTTRRPELSLIRYTFPVPPLEVVCIIQGERGVSRG